MNAIAWMVQQMATAAPVAPAPRQLRRTDPQKYLEVERLLTADELRICDIAEITGMSHASIEQRKRRMKRAGRL